MLDSGVIKDKKIGDLAKSEKWGIHVWIPRSEKFTWLHRDRWLESWPPSRFTNV